MELGNLPIAANGLPLVPIGNYIQVMIHQVFNIAYINLNPMSAKGVYICHMIKHASHQRCIYTSAKLTIWQM